MSWPFIFKFDIPCSIELPKNNEDCHGDVIYHYMGDFQCCVLLSMVDNVEYNKRHNETTSHAKPCTNQSIINRHRSLWSFKEDGTSICMTDPMPWVHTMKKYLLLNWTPCHAEVLGKWRYSCFILNLGIIWRYGGESSVSCPSQLTPRGSNRMLQKIT
jgi:hypothetical protein